MRAIDKLFWLWVVLGFAIPFALGWIIGGGLGTALTALLWGGFVRVFLLHHVTWSINSVCHFFGTQAVRHRGRVAQRVLAGAAVDGRGLAPQPPRVPDLGVPRTALLGAARGPDGAADRAAREARIVWNVVRVSPERQRSLPRSRGARVEAAQPDSSGAIVSPAPSSCSQYISASSRGPLHTIAQPELWIRSANR